MRARLAAIALTAGALGFGAASWAGVPAQAQGARQDAASRPEDAVLPALLVEVRGLRAAMEEMASAGPRVQLALGRVQLQEQRVNLQLRRIEDIRGKAAGAQQTYDRLRDGLRGIEEALKNPRPGGPPVEELQANERDLRHELARASSELQRLSADEIAAAGELANEQARWSDLNQRMDALENSLVRR
jgi:chromosome segregation ATPase